MNLQSNYKKNIVLELKKELGLKNVLECPRVKKVVVNVGIGQWVAKDSSKREEVVKKVTDDLMMITGQKPQVRPAKQSISGFSLRKGTPIGLRSTLRGKRAYDFLDRLINVVFPRVRDFQGVKMSSVDERGNITVGVTEQLVFPEISADDTDFFFGLEITIATTARNREEGIALLQKMKFPFKKEG